MRKSKRERAHPPSLPKPDVPATPPPQVTSLSPGPSWWIWSQAPWTLYAPGPSASSSDQTTLSLVSSGYHLATFHIFLCYLAQPGPRSVCAVLPTPMVIYTKVTMTIGVSKLSPYKLSNPTVVQSRLSYRLGWNAAIPWGKRGG